AMACGLPVVSTFHSGIPELVVDKKSGFLAEEGNVEEICEKMRILIQNPELRKSMGISGRKTVEEEFDIRKLTPKLEKIYDKLSDKLRFSKVRREEKREKEKEKERYRGRDRAGDMNLDKGRNASHILNMLKTGKPGYFRADLHLIKGCNSHCIMCDNWKSDMETSFNRASVSRLLNDLKKFGVTHLRFHGQEPTLNKDLISIIKEAKELGFKIGLKTNALLCAEDYVRKLCDAGLDVVYFSMDSADENIHNKHRGNNISFERNINAAKYFKRYNPGIKLMINSVITSQNYKELDHLVDLAKKIEVDSVGFVQLNTKNKQDILDLKLDKQQMAEFYFEVVPAILEKGSKSGISIDINPMPAALVDKPVDVQINKLRQAKIRQSKKQAKNQKEDSDFHKDIFHEDISHEDIFSEEISDFKDGKYGKKFFDKNICYGPFDHTTIDYDGSIYPCCAMIRDKRLAMGNVHDIEFSELWNSEKYKRYRDAIASGNCPFKEECARSHDSMAALNKAQNRTQNKDQDNPEEHSLKDSESKKSFEFQKLKTLYFLPKEHLEYVQLEKAKEMIQHAYNNVLLYKQLYDEKGIKPEDINSLEDLRKLPIITKDIIRQNFPDKLIAKDMDKSKISIEQTSGSVSESVQFASLKNNNEFNWMAYAFYMTKEWKWPQKYAKFTTFNCSAGYCSYDEEKENDKDSLKIILPSSKNIFGDDESKFMQRIELLKQSNPSILHADPVYLRALALFIEDKGIKLPFIKAISSTYELLTESNRQFLETAFNCRVFDQYGCSELGPIANSCEHGNKHIYMDKVIVEIIKDKPDAEFGRIIVTDLNNYAMPLIRYDTGDIGHFVKGVCSCGRNSGMLEIDGRVGNIVTVDGKVFTPKEIDRLFKGIQRIKLYRVVQKKEHEFKIEIMRNKQFNNAAAEKIKDEIRDNFKKYLSSDIKLEFEYVDEILPMNSGKFCLVKGLKFDRF
ncbi:MAG: radical SAM protein, partial [Nanoarchaeota archaeon]|nr:radical SAM protein [Nanoarchaeota archaeon]